MAYPIHNGRAGVCWPVVWLTAPMIISTQPFLQPLPRIQPSAPKPVYSTLYPDLHSVLAIDTTRVRYDITKRPSHDSISNGMYTQYHHALINRQRPVQHVRLLSLDFPWALEIKLSTGVSVGRVWEALYTELQEKISDELLRTKTPEERVRIFETAKRRTEASGGTWDGSSKPKKVDWLCGKTVFKGLEKKEDFVSSQLFPWDSHTAETWAIALREPR